MITFAFVPSALATDTRPAVMVCGGGAPGGSGLGFPAGQGTFSLQAKATRLPSGDQQASKTLVRFSGRRTTRSAPPVSATLSRAAAGASTFASPLRVPSTRLPSGEKRIPLNGLFVSGRGRRV